jgi:flagellar biogenesis protein FliO
MTAPLLALALALANPIGFPTPASTAAGPPIASAAPAAEPPGPRAAAPLTLPADRALGLDALLLPTAALLILALAALWASRRRRPASRLVRVLETTSLGPKRSLVVAQLGGELLVIGASEAGLQLLAARPAGLDDQSGAAALTARLHPVPDPAPEPALQPVAPPSPVRSFLSRLRRSAGPPRPDPAPPAFDALLAESAEDQELRRKLSLGQSGSIR